MITFLDDEEESKMTSHLIYLPTYLVLLLNIPFWGLSWTPLPTLISDTINGRSLTWKSICFLLSFFWLFSNSLGKEIGSWKNAYLKNLALENMYKLCPTILASKCKFSWKVCSYKYDYPFRKKLKPLMSRPLFN